MAGKKNYSPEELMRMAIKESHLSIPEHTNKTDPLVGAIIATAEGEILAQAHRGELRVGEHCEYTLIERKLVGENLKGHVLYVTLEPCTDKSRNKDKRGCSSHIMKARLGQVYVGIEDPNPKIATEGINFLRENRITVHMFPEEFQEIIRSDNANFIQEKEEEAKQVNSQELEKPKSILEKVASGTYIESLSRNAIKYFIRAASMPFDYPSDDFTQWGLQFGIFEGSNGDIRPTGLGLMLFGSNPEIVYPQTVFKVEINYGNRDSEVRDFGGPLIVQLTEILNFIRDKALKLTMDTSEGVREEISDFPFDVLREAIANAVIHRDYSKEGETNYLYIDRNKIVVKSPGEPPPPLTIDDLKTLDASSISRNPKMMFIFNQMGLAEQRGIGFSRMKHLPEKGFPLPFVEMIHGKLEITFGRTKEFISQRVGKNLTDQDQEALLFIQREGEVSTDTFARHFSLMNKTAQRRLAKLVDLGLIETKGQARSTVYIPK